MIRIYMQNNSAKICQEQTYKPEKPSPSTTKKAVQKITKNPLMAKKNPLMRSQIPQIKQTQTKVIIQPMPAKLSQQPNIKQEEAKPVKLQEKVEQKKEPMVQVKTQNQIQQEKAAIEQQKSAKSQIQIKQAKQQVIEHPKIQIKPNPLTVKKNPLAISSLKGTHAKQPQVKASLLSSKQLNQKAQQFSVATAKLQERKEEIILKKPAEIETKHEQINQEVKLNQQLIYQTPKVQQTKINEVKCESENKLQKMDQQKSIQKQQPKSKEAKIQPEKKSNPLMAKKNPLIKSQMIFKPSQIKQPTNVMPQKRLQESNTQSQNIKREENKQIKLENLNQNQPIQKLHDQNKSKQRQIKIQTNINQQRMLVPTLNIQQSASNANFQDSRFSVGFFCQSKDPQKVFKSDVEVKITDSFQKGTALSKYMVYQIQGNDKLGPFKITRKYPQFEAIRKIIRERWPGCFIPSIHSKSQLKKTELKQKQIRIVLQNFLLGLSYSQHLFYKEQVQLFLRSPEIDILEMVKQMPVLKAKDLISRYTSCFGEEMFQNVVQGQIDGQIKHFTTVLRKVIASLNNMSQKIQSLSQSFDSYFANLEKFGEIAKIYEQLCLSEYTNNSRDCAIIIKDQTSNINKLKNLQKFNPFNKLYSFINNEVADAESFLQIIISSELFALKSYELAKQIKENQSQISQISLGNKTLKTMATRKTKEQVQSELEAENRKLTQKRDNIAQIYKITEVILAKKEIEYFKTFKRNTYRDVLRQWVELTKQLHPELEELWKFIQDSIRKRQSDD